MSLAPGSVVIVHLRDPKEKYWGVLDRIETVGIQLRGLNISSFDDWMAQAASDDPPAIGLALMFVPMSRVETIFLDQQVGEVESYCQRFARRVGVSVEAFIGLPSAETGEPLS